jgi:AAA+ ATPase superfamily predicted ATPase
LQYLRLVTSFLFIWTLKYAHAWFGIIPVLIFEVQRSQSESNFQQVLGCVKSEALELCTTAMVFIVLSDANMALEFINDSERTEYFRTEDFSEKEARKFIEKMGYSKQLNNEEDIRLMFDKLGTRPTTISKVSEAVETRLCCRSCCQ